MSDVQPLAQEAMMSDAQPFLTEEDITDAQPEAQEAMSDAQPSVTPYGVNMDMSETGSIPHMDDDEAHAVASYVEVSDSCEAGDDDDDVSTDATYVPPRRDEEGESSDGETERTRRGFGSRRVRCLRGGASGTVRQHASPPGVSQTGGQSTHAVATTRMPSSHSSAVWHFFSVSAADNSQAICNLCYKKLSRGKSNTHLGTTALIRHMKSHHKRSWDERVSGTSSTHTQSRHPPPAPTASSARSTTAALLAPSEASASPSLSLALSSSWSSAHSQVSVKEMFQRKKTMSPSNPLAQRLTAGLSELLARQLLPYNLVESEAFKKFVAIGTPQWKVPGRNYFAQKAIPNLHCIVQKEIVASLAQSVGARVHLTTDTWSAKHGQGRYITYTAHWVNLLSADKPAMRGSSEELVTPPRLAGRPATDTFCTPPPSTPSSSLQSSAESSSSNAASASCSTSPAPAQLRRCFSTTRIRQCHAILGLTCLQSQSHNAEALLSALNAQVAEWLTPHQLSIGNVVCDNGTNLVSALNMGKLTHVPCMAHVCNLVVQRFVSKYPGLQGVLLKCRKLCAHFRRSYTAMAQLSEMQRQKHLPVRRLICDSPTRWNSTLIMFDRLLQQKEALTHYIYNVPGSRTSSAELGLLEPKDWMLMSNACRLMRPFEEVTNLVSRTQATISDMIPFFFFLERALRRVADQAVEEREAFSTTSPPASLHGPSTTQPEDWEEEDSEEDCGFEEEGEEQQPQQTSQGAPSSSRGVVRGWGQGDETILVLDITEEERAEIHGAASELLKMGSFMLSCLRKDPRLQKIQKKDLYWVSTLLDPRYKHKVHDMLPPTLHDKTHRLGEIANKLKQMLYATYKDQVTPPQPQQGSSRGRGASHLHPPRNTSAARTVCSSADLMLMEDMRSFLSPTPGPSSAGSNMRERIDRQVADYLALTADIDTVRIDEPLQYWVCRLDLWPELAQFALELLACPASSVLSERTFSAAGGFVTDKRSRLGQHSLDYLTFIKMNEAWIPKGLTLPDACD